MNGAKRLGPQPGEVIDRAAGLTFIWNGKQFSGYAGDTIISALAAAGERVFSRSMKYHRPRGLLTAGFHDPGCMVQVGDEPNVRGAHRLVTDAMVVSSQNTWPSLRFDVKGANRFAGQFLTAGFYYKTFMKPQRLWPAYEGVLRRFVNGGSVSPDTPHILPEKRYVHPDVLIAGGGPGRAWPRRWRPRGPAPPCCWWRRSTGSAVTCAGAARPISRPWPTSPGRWRPSPASRCSPTRWCSAVTTATGSRCWSAPRPGRCPAPRPSG